MDDRWFRLGDHGRYTAKFLAALKLPTNPYSTSKTDALEEPPRQRFRWRTLAVGIIGATGVLFVCGGLFMSFVLGYLALTGKPLYKPGPSLSYESCVAAFWCIILGSWLILAARQWWIGRWMRSIAMVAVAWLATQAAMALQLIPS